MFSKRLIYGTLADASCCLAMKIVMKESSLECDERRSASDSKLLAAKMNKYGRKMTKKELGRL